MTEQREFDRILEVLAAALPTDRLASLRTRGAAMSDDEAVAEGLRV